MEFPQVYTSLHNNMLAHGTVTNDDVGLTIEGFWSTCKNGIVGVYHSVSSKYLQEYLNEYAFRYNHRNDVLPMFWSFLTRTARTS